MLKPALLISLFFAVSLNAATNTPFKTDFEKDEAGKVPEDFLVLDGGFAVKEADGNKFLELPGAPLDSYGFLFGPTGSSNLVVTGRIYATGKGRRFPTFAIGLGGIAGYRLQVSPAKKMLELYRDQELKNSVAYQWKTDSWTFLKLQLRQAAGHWKIEGKVWTEGTPEPADWMIVCEDKEDPPTGRASAFASPFSGTPIRFDDLEVNNAGSN